MEDPDLLWNWRIAAWVSGPLDFQAEALVFLKQQMSRMTSHQDQERVKTPIAAAPPLVLPADRAPFYGFAGCERIVARSDQRWSRIALGGLLQKCSQDFPEWPNDGLVVATAWCHSLPGNPSDTQALALHKDFQQGGTEVSTIDGFNREIKRIVGHLVPGGNQEKILEFFSQPGSEEEVDRFAMRALHEKILDWVVKQPLYGLWRQEALEAALPSLPAMASFRPRF